MKNPYMKFLTLFVCVTCIAKTYGQSVFLPLITEPQGNWSPSTRYVKVPDLTEFECKARATPEAKYYWTFNGTKIISNDDYVSVDEITGTLTTGKEFDKTRSGDYQCYAYNGYGTAMTPVLQIYAADYDSFTGDLSYSRTEVAISLYIKLNCANVPYSIPQWIFNWRRGPTKTDRDPIKFEDFIEEKDKSRILIDNQGALHFLWTVKDDSFFYGCITTHSVYRVTHRSSNVNELIVKPGSQEPRGPALKYVTKDVVVYAKQDAELMCIFSYYSPFDNVIIKWFHNGKQVGSNSPNITLKAVEIPNSMRNDSGEYRCEAYRGNASDYGIVNLKIVSPPTFLPFRALATNYFPVEKDAVFHCNTSSYRAHKYPTVWFVNGVPLIGCPEREFECKKPIENGYSRCIKENLVCNGVPDCPDGEDESSCPNTCPENQVTCYGECKPKTSECKECIYPDFLCDNNMRCIKKESICDGNNDCLDGTDEICPGRDDMSRGEYIISSDRAQLTLPNLKLDQSRCFQCMSRNQYGTTIGDGCLTVIDKITILNGPNSTYNVEPGSRIDINMEATSDPVWTNQMTYIWTWYGTVANKKNPEETYIVSEDLPTKDPSFPGVFTITRSNKTIKIMFPYVRKGEEKEQENASLFNQLINRLYTITVQHRYDKVQINFTINGKQIAPPPVPIVEKASANLWFIALILGILLLFIVIALIVCYLHRNRGGTYLLDKKEVKAGHDPERELKDGFQDVGRIDDDNDDPEAEKISLSESVKHYDDSDDDPTGEYEGDLDSSKFNEEGSFIGLYGAKTKEATV